GPVVLVGSQAIGHGTRASNRGEGGSLPLLPLAFPGGPAKGRFSSRVMIAIGLAGAALLCGEGVITPAISVLSAVEGVAISNKNLAPLVVPVTIGILLGLFVIQRRGTGSIGKWFGVVMLVWFAVLGILGIVQTARNPFVLQALNPLEAFGFLASHGVGSIVVIGGVFLVMTGCEALYADM